MSDIQKTKKRTSIAIVGMGGVGGYLGAKLAKHYENNPDVEINFIARGKALEAIKENGLILDIDSPETRIVAHPNKVTNDASELGIMDYVIFCTKAYDIKDAVNGMRSAIDKNTVIIPFLNGVDSIEVIREMLPENDVWGGCVYIFAWLEAPGHVMKTMSDYRYYFGALNHESEKPAELLKLLTDANISANNHTDIVKRMWDKLAFISTVATSTSYTDKMYGEVLDTPEYKAILDGLLAEFKSVAKAKGVELSPDIAEKVVAQMRRIPANSTTSMQRDFRNRKKTELESLTGFILREAEKLGVEAPYYEMTYKALAKRMAEF